MKGAGCRDNPHTLLELEEAIANLIRNIRQIELSRVSAHITRRVDGCLQARGGHFQHMLYIK
jgi:hypothetical protein